MNEILRSRQLPDIESNGFTEFNFWLNNEYRLSFATAHVYLNWRMFVAVEEKRIAVFLEYFRQQPSLPDGCGLPQQRSAAGTTTPGGVHRRHLGRTGCWVISRRLGLAISRDRLLKHLADRGAKQSLNLCSRRPFLQA
ncbi:MAG: hypothetical protein NTW36_12050 [Planctomycetia bacterium]|nr:hypothetical protein [Planctomycetia bacterium]